MTFVFAYGDISSNPSSLFTIHANLIFKFLSLQQKFLIIFYQKHQQLVFQLKLDCLRSNHIKDCSFTYFFSNWSNKSHCTMIIWSKHKTKVIIINFFFYIFGSRSILILKLLKHHPIHILMTQLYCHV